MKNLSLKIGAVGAFVVISVMTFSCRKETATIAEIIVRDTAGVVVPGAMVRLDGESVAPTNPNSTNIVRHDSTYTNSAGVATFDYTDTFNLGQAGFAVLNISAEKDDLFGEGIIKIEAEATTKEIVYISN